MFLTSGVKGLSMQLLSLSQGKCEHSRPLLCFFPSTHSPTMHHSLHPLRQCEARNSIRFITEPPEISAFSARSWARDGATDPRMYRTRTHAHGWYPGSQIIDANGAVADGEGGESQSKGQISPTWRKPWKKICCKKDLVCPETKYEQLHCPVFFFNLMHVRKQLNLHMWNHICLQNKIFGRRSVSEECKPLIKTPVLSKALSLFFFFVVKIIEGCWKKHTGVNKTWVRLRST